MDGNKQTEILTDVVLDLLNQLHKADPSACGALVTTKIPVPDTLSDDFICQTARGGKAQLSVLGLLNSILVKSGNAKVATIVDDGQQVVGFTKNFTPVTAPAQPPKA